MGLVPLVLIRLAIAATAAAAEPPRPAPDGLMCELLAHPERAEIADPRPDFSWVVRSNEPDDLQSAYQIRVAATPEALARGDVLRIGPGRSTMGRPPVAKSSPWGADLESDDHPARRALPLRLAGRSAGEGQ